MEDKGSTDRPEKCKSTGNKPACATTSCKPKAQLRRHKSLDDLRSVLKSTQEREIVSIFLEYVHCVRLKQSTSTNAPARATMPELEHNSTEAQVSTRPTMCNYRRLRSEPNGNDISIRDAANGKCERGELSQANPSANKRPCTLSLEPQHKRVPSSDSSGKTTPAPDPPLFSPAVCELQLTCPAGNQHFQRTRSTSSPILPPSHMEAQVGTPQSQRHLCAAQSGLPPLMVNGCIADAQRQVYSRLIADRIRSMGDRIAMQFDEQQLERRLSSLILNQNPANAGFTSMLTTLRGCLSWQKVSEIFQIGYYLLEALTAQFGPGKLPQEDKRWTLFQKLWDIMMNAVVPWIWEHGGWTGLLEATEKMEGADNTVCIGATAVHTPPMAPLSSPALGTRRHRLWSLSESGIFVDEEGNTMKEVGSEQEVVRHDQQQEESIKMSSENQEVYHQESTDLQGLTLTLESDSPFCCPSEHIHSSSPPFLLLSSTPGDMPPHSQDGSELLDSGIVSSTEQLSLETHDDVDSLFDENIHTASSPDQFTMASSSSSNVVAMEASNGSEITHFQRKSSSMKEKGSGSFKPLLPLDRNRSRSLPGGHNRKGRGRRRPVKSAPVKRAATENSSRRTSETALNGLFYTVNISASAAFVYAAVSALMK